MNVHGWLLKFCLGVGILGLVFQVFASPTDHKSTDTAEIIETVNAWAKVWTNKDVVAYLAFYANDFQTPANLSRAAWEKSRQESISKPKSIQVSITNPKVTFADATHAIVTFKQSYRSNTFKDHTNKTLVLVKTGGKWVIQQERITETPMPHSGQVSANEINPLEPRYQATLSEGITFKNPGYPNFVSGVKGISIQEGFGRWTVGTEAVIEFAQPLPKKFTLKITATMYPPTMGKPIKVVIGGTKYDAKFNQMWNFKEIDIPVTTDGNVKSISFLLPDAKSPQSLGQGDDSRKVSLALSSLKIIE